MRRLRSRGGCVLNDLGLFSRVRVRHGSGPENVISVRTINAISNACLNWTSRFRLGRNGLVALCSAVFHAVPFCQWQASDRGRQSTDRFGADTGGRVHHRRGFHSGSDATWSDLIPCLMCSSCRPGLRALHPPLALIMRLCNGNDRRKRRHEGILCHQRAGQDRLITARPNPSRDIATVFGGIACATGLPGTDRRHIVEHHGNGGRL